MLLPRRRGSYGPEGFRRYNPDTDERVIRPYGGDQPSEIFLISWCFFYQQDARVSPCLLAIIESLSYGLLPRFSELHLNGVRLSEAINARAAGKNDLRYSIVAIAPGLLVGFFRMEVRGIGKDWYQDNGDQKATKPLVTFFLSHVSLF